MATVVQPRQFVSPQIVASPSYSPAIAAACDGCGRVLNKVDPHSVLLCLYANTADGKALTRLIDENLPLFKGTVRRYLNCDESTLNDSVTDIIVKVMKKARQFDCWRPARPWLFMIARNTALDVLRDRKISPIRYGTFGSEDSDDVAERTGPVFLEPETDKDETSLGIMLTEERDAKIAAALDQLSAGMRTALWLRYVERLPYREIAYRMRIRHVGTLLYKARIRFKQLLA